MNAERLFIDTNILVYAYDTSAGPKHEKASALIQDLWDNGTGSISTQVLQEFALIVSKKIPNPLSLETTAQIVEDLLKWEVIINDGQAVLDALALQQRYSFSFWDSLIVTAAIRSSAHTLISEDMSNKQQIQGILIHNPFV